MFTMLTLVVAIAIAPAALADPPPFDGTAWIASSVITPQSPSDMVSVAFVAVAPRTTYDRRANDFVTKNSYVFTGTFRASQPIDFIVDPEFTSQEAAAAQASRFAQVVGQLPRGCRTQIAAVWLHQGDENVGGGNGALLIHTDYVDQHWEYVEELLVHECAHTSLDPVRKQGPLDEAVWARAVSQDAGFISKYAADFPRTEDVAESFLPYVMWKLGGASGVASEQLATMERTIPHRFEAFELTGIDLRPLLDWPVRQSSHSPGEACARSDIGANVKTATYGWLKCAKRSDGRLLWVKVRSGRCLKEEDGQQEARRRHDSPHYLNEVPRFMLPAVVWSNPQDAKLPHSPKLASRKPQCLAGCSPPYSRDHVDDRHPTEVFIRVAAPPPPRGGQAGSYRREVNGIGARALCTAARLQATMVMMTAGRPT